MLQCEAHHTPFNINVSTQTITCIVGPLHSGKSSLLLALAGVNEFFSGHLNILGLNPNNLSKQQWLELRKKAAYVLPNTALVSHLTSMQNVVLPLTYHRIAKQIEAEEQAKDLLNWLESEANHNDLPSSLSEHEKRIVNIARALILKPDILFIDEAFAYLDILKKRQFVNRYKTIKHDKNMSLVLATHDLQAAKECADQFLFVTDNDILSFDNWQALKNSQHPCVVNYCKGFS